ncbi:MAG TPA: phosphodiester glycosidase family protein [Candidatus Nanopelagicaceae bacterium]
MKKPKQRTVLISISIVAAIFLGSLTWSIGSVLSAPGTDTVAARLAEWSRDHGLGFVVTAAENVQYWLNPPKIGGKPTGAELKDLRGQTATPQSTQTSQPQIPVHEPLQPLVTPKLDGEGNFKTVVTIHDQPAIQIAYLRPDDKHTSYLAGVAWMSGSLLEFVQHPGFSDPGHMELWSQPAMIPTSQRSGLVATFNGGFKIKNSRGGFYADGHAAGTMVKGAASLVVYSDGHSDIIAWPGTQPGPDIVSVRQNLTLLINKGEIAPNLDKNVLANWGWTIKNAYFVWRTGIGVTTSGDFVFVAGNALSIQSLANLLQRAGAVRAMELDINAEWISYMWYTPGATAQTPVPNKLLDFARPADRYFKPTSRDFFAVYAK